MSGEWTEVKPKGASHKNNESKKSGRNESNKGRRNDDDVRAKKQSKSNAKNKTRDDFLKLYQEPTYADLMVFLASVPHCRYEVEGEDTGKTYVPVYLYEILGDLADLLIFLRVHYTDKPFAMKDGIVVDLRTKTSDPWHQFRTPNLFPEQILLAARKINDVRMRGQQKGLFIPTSMIECLSTEPDVPTLELMACAGGMKLVPVTGGKILTSMNPTRI